MPIVVDSAGASAPEQKAELYVCVRWCVRPHAQVHDVLFVLKLLSTAAALGDEKEDDDEHAKKTFELSCQLFDIELPDAMDIAAGALELGAGRGAA